MDIKNGSTVLFQGDSITDAGRGASPDGLGSGYVSIIQGLLAAKCPERALKVVNRGVGGDRTCELLARWKADCLDIKPDVLSLKIGVNDVWRLRGSWNGQSFVEFKDYAANYRRLLEMALESGIRKFILLSPSAIADNQDAELSAHLDERAAFVRDIAKEFKAVYVPVRETQKDAMLKYPQVKWTSDGCHPTVAGHALIAEAWMKAAGL